MQDHPGCRLDHQRHGRGRGDDCTGKGGIDTYVTKPLDDPPAEECTDGEPDKIAAAEHEARHGGIEILGCHSQSDKGPENPLAN
jgi:hypothetical protein